MFCSPNCITFCPRRRAVKAPAQYGVRHFLYLHAQHGLVRTCLIQTSQGDYRKRGHVSHQRVLQRATVWRYLLREQPLRELLQFMSVCTNLRISFVQTSCCNSALSHCFPFIVSWLKLIHRNRNYTSFTRQV
jgi:hypothetical protein